jgi:hypothetical protein
MGAKHTPGPWCVAGENRARRVIKGGGAKPRTVCIIEDWTTEPDAALLAAAPDLAAACEAVRAAYEDVHRTSDAEAELSAAVVLVRAALQKAGLR